MYTIRLYATVAGRLGPLCVDIKKMGPWGDDDGCGKKSQGGDGMAGGLFLFACPLSIARVGSH